MAPNPQLAQYPYPVEQENTGSVVNETVSSEVTSASSDIIGFMLLLVIVALIVGVVAFLIRKKKIGSQEKNSLESSILEVRLPKENEVEIKAAEQLYTGLYDLAKVKGIDSIIKSPPHITFEIVAFPDSIRFYVVVPKKYRTMVEKQIHAVYTTAEVVDADEYNLFSVGTKVSYSELRLLGGEYKPIRTMDDLGNDPMASITNSMSKLVEGEAAAVQIMIRPTDGSWRKKGKGYVGRVRGNNSDPEKKRINVSDDVLSGIEQKCAKSGFYTVIRVVTVGNSSSMAKTHLDNIVSSFQQFNREGMGKIGKYKPSRFDKSHFPKDFLYRIMPPAKESVLNIDELSTLFHFPNKNIHTPSIHWLLSKRAPAGGEIPEDGDVWLGTSIYRNVSRPVSMLMDDRRRHMYVVGKTGSGKSKFLNSMALQDIINGKGVAFLDPHGEEAEFILERIPPERAEDVIYFNPADIDRPLGFNMMEYFDENDKHRVVNSFIGLLYKMFDPHQQGIVGPRLERAVRNAMLTAMAEQGNTLIEVVRLITDPKFVQQKLPLVQDDMVRRYWTDEIAQTSDFHKSEVLGYIVSKFDRFITNKLMRNIVGQSKSSFNLRHIMDEGKILIVNLSKGQVGEENAQFLGLLLIPKILSAAMSRADIPQDERKDFYLYVDEFQNFATEEFAQILSEARKYRLNLIVGNQYIAQIDPKIRDAVFGNVGSIVSFKVGVQDADYLQNEFYPVFTQNDLINLENINAYAKVLVKGEAPAPFSMATWYDLKNKYPPNLEVSKMITELSRLRYGRDKDIVEAEIRKRAQLS